MMLNPTCSETKECYLNYEISIKESEIFDSEVTGSVDEIRRWNSPKVAVVVSEVNVSEIT